MAKKRMTTTQITDSDDFIAMPSPAQALYLHLNNGADDDGFNNQVQMAMYKAHASIDDLKLLLAKRFILQFDSGVIVIKHWRMANSLRKDRYTPTVFQEELKQLGIKENGAYTWLPNGCQMVAIDKDSIDKNSIDKLSIDNKKFKKPTIEEIQEYINERHSDIDANRFYDYYETIGWKVGKNPMKDWKACVRTWESKNSKSNEW